LVCGIAAAFRHGGELLGPAAIALGLIAVRRIQRDSDSVGIELAIAAIALGAMEVIRVLVAAVPPIPV
jgi:hypothetical protein